ncbi:MAG: helix-turn-helix domain-containing protein [Firmicutes bacterium]|nr:helix-turn-helix domain-containing protein [Bacillota bacterium]
MDQIKIGHFLAELRKEQGMTQVQFAEKLGVTNKAISKWETGKCLPDAALFQDICSLLGITVNEFLNGERIPAEQAEEKSEEKLVEVVAEYQKKRDWYTVLQRISLILLIISVIFTIDLGVNYMGALLVDYHDGITLNGMFSGMFFGDSNWTLPRFFEKFQEWLAISGILAIENAALYRMRTKSTNR